MSYREVRNFTEMMHALGYPRLISMENFRLPNFPLVVEILAWLIQRYDPTADISTDIETEQDRVIFIKSATQLMATKAHVKLNTKKLYGADGYAVKELLKVSSVLYSAMRSNEVENDSDADQTGSIELSNKTTDLKACRQLASEITSKGAKLFDLLGREVDLREARQSAILRPVDIDEIEQGIEKAVQFVNDEIRKINDRMENASSDEDNLKVKIEKKKQDLERNRKRLKKLAHVRPAFMDEYERLEGELQRQYDVYVEKFCNLSFLEQQLEEHRQVERSRLEEHETTLRQVQLQIRQEEEKMLHGVILSDELGHIESGHSVEGRHIVGNMTGEGIASDDGSGSLSSGSGNIIRDEDNDIIVEHGDQDDFSDSGSNF